MGDGFLGHGHHSNAGSYDQNGAEVVPLLPDGVEDFFEQGLFHDQQEDIHHPE